MAKKIKYSGRIQVHGHRGSRGTHPENTLPAFQEAASAGADFIEMDVHLSADNVVIVFHDPAITKKLCRDGSGKLVKRPRRIRLLKASEISDFDCGSVKQKAFPFQRLIPHTRIPTLEEVLKWKVENAPTLGLNIELKMEAKRRSHVPQPEDFVKQVLQLIYDYGVRDTCLLQSFDPAIIEAGQNLEPGLRYSWLFGRRNCFKKLFSRMGVPIGGPNYRLLSKKSVEGCHQQGIKVIPWTVNKERDWIRLIEMGVDGIITDYPRKLVQFLETKVYA